MEYCKINDDTKIIAAIICLLMGLFFIWNIAAHITDIYELQLDKDTCNLVKTSGLAPSANCVVTAPYRTAGLGPVGYMALPGGSYIQISPITANRTNKSAEWSTSMKAQFWIAMLFWGASIALLLSAFRDRK